MIRFNVPPFTGKEYEYIKKAVDNQKICGDGEFTAKCNEWLQEKTGADKVLLTTSCTHATEMAAILTDIGPGDEVIMPAYTFVSTADAFVMRGAKAVFVDIRPDTMNIDEKLIEQAITPKTKAIVPVHYAGVGCEMDAIMEIAAKYNLQVIEDAAQGIMSSYKGKALGTFGEFGCFSFHETKNFSMGEGGALLIRDEKDIEQAEIVREKGTESTVHEACDEDFIIGGLAFAFHEAARETPGGVILLLVVYLEGEEVGTFGDFLGACYGGEEHGATHLDDGRSVSLLGKFASFDFNHPTVGKIDFLGNYVHYCVCIYGARNRSARRSFCKQKR